jgi:hypothetical protein
LEADTGPSGAHLSPQPLELSRAFPDMTTTIGTVDPLFVSIWQGRTPQQQASAKTPPLPGDQLPIALMLLSILRTVGDSRSNDISIDNWS